MSRYHSLQVVEVGGNPDLVFHVATTTKGLVIGDQISIPLIGNAFQIINIKGYEEK